MITGSRKVIIFMFATILCASQGFSEQVPITVKVNFEVSAITNEWSEYVRNRVTKDSCREIVQVLKSVYKHWDFRTDDKGKVITFLFRIVDPDPDDTPIEANLQLDVLKKNNVEKSWSRKWLLPTDLQYRNYPTKDTMANQLALKIWQFFIDDRTVPLNEWLLANVPVGKSGAWMNDPNAYLIVLSMPREQYRDLCWSVFKIMEQTPSDVPEALEALGQGKFAPYPVTNDSSSFNGITVRVVKRETIHGAIKKLEPEIRNVKALGPIYLKEEKHFDPMNVFYSDEDDQ